jgi:hypothetical protein
MSEDDAAQAALGDMRDSLSAHTVQDAENDQLEAVTVRFSALLKIVDAYEVQASYCERIGLPERDFFRGKAEGLRAVAYAIRQVAFTTREHVAEMASIAENYIARMK